MIYSNTRGPAQRLESASRFNSAPLIWRYSNFQLFFFPYWVSQQHLDILVDYQVIIMDNVLFEPDQLTFIYEFLRILNETGWFDFENIAVDEWLSDYDIPQVNYTINSLLLSHGNSTENMTNVFPENCEICHTFNMMNELGVELLLSVTIEKQNNYRDIWKILLVHQNNKKFHNIHVL